jgi:hypothetical protein
MNRQLIEGIAQTLRSLPFLERKVLLDQVKYDEKWDEIRERPQGYEFQYITYLINS